MTADGGDRHGRATAMLSALASPRVLAFAVAAISTIPVAGLFTLSKIFYLRDLTIAFRPRFLFLRHALFSGSLPWWDPYPANGQPAVNDALYQIFHLPSLLIRLLPPEIVAYNLWVALPVPLSALGMYLFLRRHVPPIPAMFGAVAFGLSGPIVSTTNFPNMSWSVAAVPYVFWALERVFDRRDATATALLAATVSCQALAGEPVTLATTLVLAAAYALCADGRWRDRRGVALVAVGMAAGLLLSAVQYVPMAFASRHSMRSTMEASDFWAFHPLALIELFAPQFFGDYSNSQLAELGWMMALNSGREPFYYTMYLGVPVLLLAAVAIASGRRHTRFWAAAIAICALASLGPHSPFYPALQALVPPLRVFRFPVKYLSLASFGVATLAALTLRDLIDGVISRRALRFVVLATSICAAAVYVALAWIFVAPELPARAFYHLAAWANVHSPVQGAAFLLIRARPLLTALLLKLIAGGFLLAVAGSVRRERRLALAALGAVAVVDLLAANSGVNPTLDASILAAPPWLQHIPRDMHERVYVGGRIEGYVNVLDVDAPKYRAYRDDLYSVAVQQHLVVVELLMYPSGAGVREALSYDLPLLWPLDYARMVGRFKFAPREDRLRFLERVGTRFVILPTPPYPGATPLARLRGIDQMQLYDFNPQARRAYIVPDALRGPDVAWQLEGLFQARYNPSSGVLVSETPPPAAGTAGPPVAAAADFVEDGLNRVVIRAGMPGDGYLALLDSFDPDWKVDVDGGPAPLMRVNALFRAVHLTSGRHVVTFTYHPSRMYLGAWISGLTAAALLLWMAWSRRRGAAGPGAAAAADAAPGA